MDDICKQLNKHNPSISRMLGPSWNPTLESNVPDTLKHVPNVRKSTRKSVWIIAQSDTDVYCIKPTPQVSAGPSYKSYQ
jgi:hypothetical protein